MTKMRWPAGVAVLLLLATACGSQGQRPQARPTDTDSFSEPFSDKKAYPVFASSEIVVGENRFLVGLLNRNDAPIGSPDIEMKIDFFDLSEDDQEADAHADMDFVWIDEPVRGLYEGYVEFDSAGRWGAEITVAGKLQETMRAGFEVARRASTPAVGEEVPASDTPTAADVDKLSEITTDRDPEPRFYQTSVAEALRKDVPFVLIFSTPKFCASQTCGPMLEDVEKVARKFPDVTFIHVEPYDLSKAPEKLEPVKAAIQWGLPSEPWTFVVGADGELDAKYEGVIDPDDLASRLKKLR